MRIGNDSFIYLLFSFFLIVFSFFFLSFLSLNVHELYMVYEMCEC